MVQLSIRLPDGIYEIIRSGAQKNHHSMNAEILNILEEAINNNSKTPVKGARS